jgi:hypothetical protein
MAAPIAKTGSASINAAIAAAAIQGDGDKSFLLIPRGRKSGWQVKKAKAVPLIAQTKSSVEASAGNKPAGLATGLSTYGYNVVEYRNQ